MNEYGKDTIGGAKYRHKLTGDVMRFLSGNQIVATFKLEKPTVYGSWNPTKQWKAVCIMQNMELAENE